MGSPDLWAPSRGGRGQPSLSTWLRPPADTVQSCPHGSDGGSGGSSRRYSKEGSWFEVSSPLLSPSLASLTSLLSHWQTFSCISDVPSHGFFFSVTYDHVEFLFQPPPRNRLATPYAAVGWCCPLKHTHAPQGSLAFLQGLCPGVQGPPPSDLILALCSHSFLWGKRVTTTSSPPLCLRVFPSSLPSTHFLYSECAQPRAWCSPINRPTPRKHVRYILRVHPVVNTI